MEASCSLAHHERLRSRGSIRRLFESGQSGFVYPLRYMWFAEACTESPSEELSKEVSQHRIMCEVLFTVPKRFHKRANKRNALRRKIKESYRLQKSLLLNSKDIGCNIDLAIVYSTKEQHTYKTIDHAVRKILTIIAKDI